MTLSCDISSQPIQGLLESYFDIKKSIVDKKRIHYLCEGGKKIRPSGSPFVITRQASTSQYDQ